MTDPKPRSTPTLLSIDPGAKHVGLCVYVNGQFTTCTIECSIEAVYNFILEGFWDRIILEGFSTPGLIASFGIQTVELIGAVKALCWLKHIPLTVQYPIERHGDLVGVKEMFKGKRGMTRHEKDAYAHMVTYMRTYVREHKPSMAELDLNAIRKTMFDREQSNAEDGHQV